MLPAALQSGRLQAAALQTPGLESPLGTSCLRDAEWNWLLHEKLSSPDLSHEVTVEPGEQRPCNWLPGCKVGPQTALPAFCPLPPPPPRSQGCSELKEEGGIRAGSEPLLDAPVSWAGLCAPGVMTLASVCPPSLAYASALRCCPAE